MADVLGPLTAKARIIHKRGDDFIRSFTFEDEDGAALDFGAGATARFVVKADYDRPGSPAATLLEWSSTNSPPELVVTAASGQVDFQGPKADMNPSWEEGVYDLEITYGSGRVATFMSGPFELLPQVT